MLVGSYARCLLTSDQTLEPYFTLVRNNKVSVSEILEDILRMYIYKGYYEKALRRQLPNSASSVQSMSPQSIDKMVQLFLSRIKKMHTKGYIMPQTEISNVINLLGKHPMEFQENTVYDNNYDGAYIFKFRQSYNLNKNMNDEEAYDDFDKETDIIAHDNMIFSSGNAISNLFPTVKIYGKAFTEAKVLDEISEDLLDFNKVIYYNGKFKTNIVGKYALENKIHFSSNYHAVIDKNLDEMNLVSDYKNRGLLTGHEIDQYCYYDPYIKNKLKRNMDY